MSDKNLKTWTREEVARHSKEGDLWIIVDAKVYDLSRFSSLHPGGPSVLLTPTVAGQDATKAFFGLHRHEVLLRPQYARLQIGVLVDEQSLVQPPTPGALSAVPYAEPSFLAAGHFSPYYSEGHRRFQRAIREFIEREVLPDATRCEDSGARISKDVVRRLGETNILAMRLGPGKHLHGRTLMDGTVKPEEFDYFHELIINLELGRLGMRSYLDGLLAGLVIGLPPVLNFGSEEIKARVVPEVLRGDKIICLAISEPSAGSDVQGVTTWADFDESTDEWVVSGCKKWITNGMFSDYFTTLCQSKSGPLVLLIPRTDDVETKPLKTSYSSTAGTALVLFNRARVPKGNVLGKVGQGVRVILSNFNHERWMIATTSVGAHRRIVEECLKWTNQRMVYGKPLSSQAVVRAKLANMIARVEAAQNWLESVTHQMCNMSYEEQSDKIAGQIGLLKQFISRVGRESAEDATQIFGGRGITASGMGKLVEIFHRTSPYDAILGGAEDVLGDLGVRQAIRKMPQDARL